MWVAPTLAKLVSCVGSMLQRNVDPSHWAAIEAAQLAWLHQSS